MDPLNDETMERLERLLRRAERPEPDLSVIIPVNAQEDLQKVLTVLDDISHYRGTRQLELILVINNYPPDRPPTEAIEMFRQRGMRIVATPSARRPGEVVIISARALGVRAARAEATVHFDADCRLVDSTALLDWYAERLSNGADLAYSHVGYYGLRENWTVRFKIALHHRVRWLKRNLFGIPTARGSNYAVTRSAFLRCYEAGRVGADIQLAPVVRLAGGRVAYSAQRRLWVLTSGRRHTGNLRRMLPYFLYRLRYNLHVLPTRFRPAVQGHWDGFDLETEQRLHRLSLGEQSLAPGAQPPPPDREQS